MKTINALAGTSRGSRLFRPAFARARDILFAAAALLLLLSVSARGAGTRPNIVIIMADDLGYGDLGGVWGGKAHTPHLDRMAREGLRFTDFHSSAPVCSPTRAALVTGRYPQRLGIVKALNSYVGGEDGESLGLGAPQNSGDISIATYLRRAGYATGIFGKWHLGGNVAANPMHFGFDEFRGLTGGCGDYFSKVTRYGEADWWQNGQLEFQEGHATPVTTANAIDFIKRHAGRPFFLYVPYSAIHFPWQSTEDDEQPARRVGHPVTRPGEVHKVGPHQAAALPGVARLMIEEIDQGVGQIMSALRQHQLEKTTLVIFKSDNGGYHSYPYQGVTTPVSSNGLLRGGKTQVYEGGHRVPFIAWWPGSIAAGRVTEETAVTMDLVPTALDLAGLPHPAPDGPNRLDGVSLVPSFLRSEPLPSRALFWQTPPGRTGIPRKAVRYGSWKLVDNELYHLGNDLGETRNLAKERPDIVRELQGKLQAWEKEVFTPALTGAKRRVGSAK